MLNPETVSVFQKFLGRESSQVDIGRLLDYQVETALGLAAQEILYFLNYLKAVFGRHLKV
jgi:hypothetical protein